MNLVDPYRFKKPNTFIGGVGGIINTPAILVSKTNNLIESDIESFSVDVNNNVRFYVSKPIIYISSVFDEDSTFTYYIDFDGWVSNNPIAFFRNSNGIAFWLPNLEGLGLSTFRNCKNRFINLPNVVNGLGTNSVRDNVFAKWAKLENAILIDSPACFRLLTGIERISLLKVVDYGVDQGGSTLEMFYDLNFGCKIYCDPSQLTIDAGNPVHALDYAESVRGAILIGVSNLTPPNNVVDLSASSITSSSCVLNFTIPSSLNTLDFYEVWIERQDLDYWHHLRVSERYNIYQEVITTGNIVNGLVSGVTYKMKIYACDEFWNRSGISNEIEITTL